MLPLASNAPIPEYLNSTCIICMVLQIFTWRPCKTRATRSIKPWGWEVWDPCSAAFTPVAVPTASPGPPITETAAPRRATSDRGAVSGSQCRDDHRITSLLVEMRVTVVMHREFSNLHTQGANERSTG